MSFNSTKKKQPQIHSPSAESQKYGVFTERSKKFNLYSIIASAIVVAMCLAALLLPFYSFRFMLGSRDGSKVTYEKKYSYSILGAALYVIGSDVDKYGQSKNVEDSVKALKDAGFSKLEKAQNVKDYWDEIEDVLQEDCNESASELREALTEAESREIDEQVAEFKKGYWDAARTGFAVLSETFIAELEARNADGLKEFLDKSITESFDDSKLEKLAEKYLVGEYEINDDFIDNTKAASVITGILPNYKDIKDHSFDELIFPLIISVLALAAMIVTAVSLIKSVMGFTTGACKKIQKKNIRNIIAFVLFAPIASLGIFAWILKNAEWSYDMLCRMGIGSLTIVMVIFCVLCFIGTVIVSIMANKEFDALEKEIGAVEASADTDAKAE